MGNKDENTNLIGRKGSKMTMQSNVKTLALKVYDEQIPDGWDKLKERIKELKKDEYQCLGIRHDEDVLGDDFFEPSTEKPHYHILIRVMRDSQNVTKSGKHVSTILNDLGIIFRKEDATMIANHGIETVGDFGAYATYLTHDTEKAIADGKQHYSTELIVSNLNPEEVTRIRDGYIRVSQKARKVTLDELQEIDEHLYDMGKNRMDYDDWYDQQSFVLRKNTSMETLEKRYQRGIERSVQKDKYINRTCIFITGEGNSGKSYTSAESLRRLGYEKILTVDNAGTGQLDELTPTTQAIIIDDQTAPSLLNLCDTKPSKAYKRGSGNPYFTGDKIVVTSNLSFEKWAKACRCKSEQLESYKSRFFICELNEDGKLHCTSLGNRGTEQQRIERLADFTEFKTMYDSIIEGYKKGDLSMYEKLLTSGNEQDFEKLKSLLKCHKVCSKTFAVKSNTVRLKRDKDKIQKRFLSGK